MSRYMLKLLNFFLFLIFPGLLYSQTTGSISGKVVYESTGAPLPGATVLLKGTCLGASTDLDGRYSIADILAGSYTVRASHVGVSS